VCDGRDLIREVAYGGSGLIREVAFGESGLIREVAFGGSGLITPLIRPDFRYTEIVKYN
jgi:hypothetical protein